MSDPREMWNNLQKNLQRVQQQGQRYGGSGGGGGNPRKAFGGIALAGLAAGGLWAFQNALFNGLLMSYTFCKYSADKHSRRWMQSSQIHTVHPQSPLITTAILTP